MDAISTVFMTEFVRNGGQVALAAADLFGYLGAHHGRYGTVDFADEHSLDLQRMYDIACLVYGSDEKKWASVALHSGRASDTLRRRMATERARLPRPSPAPHPSGLTR